MSGRLVAITDITRAWDSGGSGLALTNLDLDVVRPYLDSVPFYGTITGRLGADGFFRSMHGPRSTGSSSDARIPGAETAWRWTGCSPGRATTGMVFEGPALHTDVDLRT